jgi:hypothetical protein
MDSLTESSLRLPLAWVVVAAEAPLVDAVLAVTAACTACDRWLIALEIAMDDIGILLAGGIVFAASHLQASGSWPKGAIISSIGLQHGKMSEKESLGTKTTLCREINTFPSHGWMAGRSGSNSQ